MKPAKTGTPRPGPIAVALFVTIAGCGGDVETRIEEPVPTTVEIAPASAALTAIGATQGFNAVVRDQYGRAMPNASVSWSSSNAAVFTVSGSGSNATVTAAGNGPGTLAATSGQASGTASVEVEQRATRLEVLSGDEQEAVRGTTLSEPLVVRIADQGGTVVAGVPVTFLPDSGHGSVSERLVETDADGRASTEWTLGVGFPRQSLWASVDDLVHRFKATATADPPIPDLEFAAVALSREDPSVLESIEVMAEIVNRGDGGTPGVFKLALAVNGELAETVEVGRLGPDASTTVAVTLGSFTAGTNTIELMLDPEGDLEEWVEDNNSASRSIEVVDQKVIPLGGSVEVSSPGAESATFLFRVDVTEASNEALNIVLSGGVTDRVGLYVHYGDRPGSPNDYRCHGEGTALSCQLLPTRVGAYHIALWSFSAFGPATLTATVGGRFVEDFNIELMFLGNGTASQHNIVEQAAERWESVIGRGVANWISFPWVPFPEDECFPGQPAFFEVVDDMAVWVSIDSIDGEGGVVGNAGPCHVRDGGGLPTRGRVPTLGAILLDEADVALMETRGVLESAVTHELAHVLGFGTLWQIGEELKDPSLPNRPDADTHFAGPLALPAFDAIGGADYSGARVPVENGAEEGSSDAHWRESVFGDELMTPYLTGDTQPLSLVTIESLYDIWYEVNLTAADPFSLSSAGRAGMAMPRGPFIDLSNDVADWPIHVGDPKTGRLLRVIYPRRGR